MIIMSAWLENDLMCELFPSCYSVNVCNKGKLTEKCKLKIPWKNDLFNGNQIQGGDLKAWKF